MASIPRASVVFMILPFLRPSYAAQMKRPSDLDLKAIRSQDSGLLINKLEAKYDDMPLPAPPQDFPKELDATVEHISRFVKAAPEGAASLLLLGDSTIRTMNNMLAHIGKVQSVHVKNDRPSDGPGYPILSSGSTVIEPGAEWHDARYASHPVVLRAIAASKEIQRQGCSWGGTLETMLVGDPMEGLIVHYWNFLPEYSSHGCWQQCMADAVKVLEPRAMMWNIGMHLMNEKFDIETCQKRHSHASSNCGDYEQLVTLGMRGFAAVVPTVVWKTTNAICDKVMMEHDVEVAENLPQWKDPKQRPVMEEQCHKQCPFFKSTEACYDWLAVSDSTQRMYKASMTVAETYQKKSTFAKVHVLDAYDVTKTCCDSSCPDTPDGMHYINGTDAFLMKSLAKIIADDEVERR